MATADAGALDALLSSVKSGEAAVQAMLAELAESAGLYGRMRTRAMPSHRSTGPRSCALSGGLSRGSYGGCRLARRGRSIG
jgi:hypothetical protein